MTLQRRRSLLTVADPEHGSKRNRRAVSGLDAYTACLNLHERTIPMRKNLSLALALLALLGVAPLLGACHTTAGAGKDISAAGHAITGSAEKHTP